MPSMQVHLGRAIGLLGLIVILLTPLLQLFLFMGN